MNLKPCLFCGAHAKMIEDTDPNRIDAWAILCSANAHNVWYASEAEAIAAWNTRPAHTPPQANPEVRG